MKTCLVPPVDVEGCGKKNDERYKRVGMELSCVRKIDMATGISGRRQS